MKRWGTLLDVSTYFNEDPKDPIEEVSSSESPGATAPPEGAGGSGEAVDDVISDDVIAATPDEEAVGMPIYGEYQTLQPSPKKCRVLSPPDDDGGVYIPDSIDIESERSVDQAQHPDTWLSDEGSPNLYEPDGWVHPDGATTSFAEWRKKVGIEDSSFELAVLKDGLRMWMITVTFPGGVTDEQSVRLHACLGNEKQFPYFFAVREGGPLDPKHHVHYHALVWVNQLQRHDNVTRHVRGKIYTKEELGSLDRTNRLVRTSHVTDFDQAWFYVLKRVVAEPKTEVIARLPGTFDLDGMLEKARTWESEVKEKDKKFFPDPGTTKWWDNRSVPDNLYRAMRELGMAMGTQVAFAELIAACYGKGIRFDLSKGKAFRLALEMIVAADSGGASQILIYDLMGQFN